MDPNATLAEIRRLSKQLRGGMDAIPDDTAPTMDQLIDWCSDMQRLIDLTDALDQSIANGESLPDAWSRTQLADAEHAPRCPDCGSALTDRTKLDDGTPTYCDECDHEVSTDDEDDGERLACEECGESFNVKESYSETHCARCAK